MTMMRTMASIILVGSLMSGVVPVFPAQSTVAYAQDAWKTEFDEICGKSDEAATLAKAEVKNLLERCDRLRPRIEKLDESARKVYLKRLQSCRDLFSFVLESTTDK
jgi:uncharacterized protein YkvS